MSLHALAGHMATKGRGGDSMLVHMTPGEVAGLQALAVKHGGELTINPDTGLPEANFLKKLLPTLIGAGLTYFSGGIINPMMAAGIVGGVETARTGDIGRGLSAGLGAYGGAGMTASLTGAGASAIGANASTAAQLAGEAAATEAGRIGLEQGLTGQALDAVKQQALQEAANASGMGAFNATAADKLSAGFNAVTKDPTSAGAFLKANAKPLMYGAAPLLAGDAVQAKMPQTVTRPGMIRPYSFDPYGGTYTAGTPYEAMPAKAAGGGLMGMADGGYSPGQLDFAERSEPVVRMASGGVVALAAGGTPPTISQDYVNQLVREAAQQAGGTLSFADASNAAKNLGVSPAMLSSAASSTGLITGAPTAQTYFSANPDVAASFQQNSYGLTPDQFAQVHFNKHGQYEDRTAPVMANVAPAAILQSAYGPNSTAAALGASHIVDGIQLIPGAPGYDPVKAATRLAEISTYEGNAGQGAAATLKANNLYDTGMAQWQAEYNRLHQQDIDAGRVPVGTPAAKVGAPIVPSGLSAAAQYSLLNSDVGVGADKVGGLRGLNSLVLDFLKQYPNATQAEINAAKKLYGYNDADVVRPYEHGFQLTPGQEAAAQKYLQDNPDVTAWLNTSEGKNYIKNNPTFDASDIAYTHYKRYGEKEGRAWGVPIKPDVPITTGVNLPGGVSGGGTTIVNPNGTVTTRPNIPGIPEGGFTGMGQVRDAYTQGGGSLGYLSPTYTRDQFKEKYEDKLTGGSKQAYDYLTGKTTYSATPSTPTGEIQKPYWESVGRFPENRKAKKYVYVDGKYQLNPDYVKPAYVIAGEKAAALTNQDKEPTDSPGAGNKWVWSSAEKKWEAKPIGGTTTTEEVPSAANGGLMAMAGGGATSQYNLGGYSDGGRLLRGPGDGVSDSIPATIGNKRPARLADGEFVVPARIVSELGNGSTEAGARKLYAMMDRVQAARRGTVGKKKVAKNSRADKHLPA